MSIEETKAANGRVPDAAPTRRLAADVEPWATIMKYVTKPSDDPSTWIFPKRGTPPPEMAGKWVAWAADMQTIVASGDSLKEIEEQIGDQVVSYQYVPPR